MGQGGVFEVGVDLFDDRVAAVDLVGDNSVGVGGGEEGVEAPGVEQGRLGVVRCGVEVGDAAHHQAALDLFGGFSGAECGECDLGDLGAGDPSLGGFVVDGVGVFDGRPRVLVDGGDGGFDCRVQTHGDRGDQRIQPADPGVAVPGSLFGVAVDFDDGVVDVDQDGAFDPVQQRRAFGQPGQ